MLMIVNASRPISPVSTVEKTDARTKRPMSRATRDASAKNGNRSVVVAVEHVKQNRDAISQ